MLKVLIPSHTISVHGIGIHFNRTKKKKNESAAKVKSASVSTNQLFSFWEVDTKKNTTMYIPTDIGHVWVDEPGIQFWKWIR